MSDWWQETRDGSGWKGAPQREVRTAFEADFAVPEAQFYGPMSPAWWTLDDVRPDRDEREPGGEA